MTSEDAFAGVRRTTDAQPPDNKNVTGSTITPTLSLHMENASFIGAILYQYSL
jgi:hypothetical protein